MPVTTAATTDAERPGFADQPDGRVDPTRPGSVTPASGTVRALQTYSGGPTVEAAFAPVDATSGAYSLHVADRRAAEGRVRRECVDPAFVPDPAAASKFTIQAASGAATQQQAIDLGFALPGLNFTFP